MDLNGIRYHKLNYIPRFYHPFVSKISKKEIVVKSMIVLNFILVLALYLYFQGITNAFPLSVRQAEYSDYSDHSITWDSIEGQKKQLEKLINSAPNKAVYTQLQNSNDAFYDPETNTVGTGELPEYNQYQRQPYVSNGYIGSRIPNLGQGFTYDQLSDMPDATEDDLSNGWPLFNERFSGSFIAGFYDIQKNTTETNFPELLENGYESVLSAVPQWTSLTLSATQDGKNYTLDPSLSSKNHGDVTNYVQNLSLSNGIVTTEFTWLKSVQIKLEVIAHRSQVNLGIVNLQIANLKNESVDLLVEDKLDFGSTQRCQLTEVNHDNDGIFITFQPHEVNYVNGAMYSKMNYPQQVNGITRDVSNDTSSQSIDFTIDKSKSINISKFVGIVSSDLDPHIFDSREKVLNHAKETATRQPNVQDLVNSHILEWSKILESNSIITFPDEPLLTLASRASIYHLNANTRPDSHGVTAALPVGGLSSDSYGGMVFWDTDLWMLNGLLPFSPTHAKSIVNYRIHTHEQAINNVPQNYSGATYPWTSGRFGNCTSTGPCMDYEYHINIAVAMAAWEVYLSGAADDEYLETVTYPLINDAATFLSDYVVYNESLGQYVTYNMTDPDEYANHVDNAAYTNSGISLLMKWAILISNHLGKAVPSKFTDIAGNIHLPTSNNADNITLEYTGMNSSVGIKQADVIMMTYPFENELITEDQAYKNMEFYSMKQVNYGPAMTFPIFSIVASNLSPSGCASQSYLHKAAQPFLRGPFAQFSEQNNDNFLTNGGTHPAFPFMTAHGGFLQAILQGLTGLRFDYEVDQSTSRLERVLTFDPISLPCFGSGVQFESIKYMNHTLSLAINETSFIVKNNGCIGEADIGDSIKISIAKRNPKSGLYTLKNSEELVIPLFEPEPSYPSSISECGSAKFINITEGAYGDASMLINDGDNTTHWQLKYNDTTAKILVDLKQNRNVTSGLLNWGDKPPKSLEILAFGLDRQSRFTDLEDEVDFLSKVDFGNDLYKKYEFKNSDNVLYKQSEIFKTVLKEKVEISAPFDPKEYSEIEVPLRHNTTSFNIDQGLDVRFLLIEVKDIHDTEMIDDSTGGSKLHEILFF